MSVGAEERHLPSLSEQRFDEAGDRQEEGCQVGNELGQYDDEQTEKRKSSERPVDHDNSQESDAFGQKEDKSLSAMKTDEFAVFCLPEAEETKEEQVSYGRIPPFMIGEKYGVGIAALALVQIAYPLGRGTSALMAARAISASSLNGPIPSSATSVRY